MPGALDTIFGPLAKNLIAKFGKTATLRVNTSTFNVATGKNTVTPTDYSVVVTPPQPIEKRFINGTTVLEGDAVCMIARAAISVVPVAGNFILLDGVPWQIITQRPVYSGELVAAYELQIRQ